MTDESSAAIAATRRDWSAWHKDLYISTGGADGHIVDVADIGGHNFQTTLLLRYVGRKSGKTMVTPLIYGDYGGEIIVVGSKGGADQHPAWYLNVRDMDEVEFQIATQAFRASWRIAEGEEHETLWKFMCSVFPPYVSYQSSTDRQIPLLVMKPIAPIDRITDDFK